MQVNEENETNRKRTRIDGSITRVKLEATSIIQLARCLGDSMSLTAGSTLMLGIPRRIVIPPCPYFKPLEALSNILIIRPFVLR